MMGSDIADVRSNRGWIASKTPHGNALPHMHAKWEAADGHGGWHLLQRIVISATPPPMPTSLSVTSSVHPEVSGTYTLPNEPTYHNGFPFWVSGGKRLYSGEGGWWLVDPDPKHMEVDRGLLASTQKHGGIGPHDMLSWEVADGKGGWVRDDRCAVTSADEEIKNVPTISPAHLAMAPPKGGVTENLFFTPNNKTPSADRELQEELTQLKENTVEREKKMIEEINSLRDQLANAKAAKNLLQSDHDAAALQQQRMRSENLDAKAKYATLEATLTTTKELLAAATTEAQETNQEKEKLLTQIEVLHEAAAKADTISSDANTTNAALLSEASVREAVLIENLKEIEIELSTCRSEISASERLADSQKHETALRERLARRLRKQLAKQTALAKSEKDASCAKQLLLEEEVTAVKKEVAAVEAGLQQSNHVNETLTARCAQFERLLEGSEEKLSQVERERDDHVVRARCAAEATVRAAADSLMLLLRDNPEDPPSGCERSLPPPSTRPIPRVNPRSPRGSTTPGSSLSLASSLAGWVPPSSEV